MLPQMLRRVFPGDLSLAELLHHLSVLMPLCLIEVMAILRQEKVCCCKRSPLVSINERMVAGNAFGVAGRELERIILTVSMKVFRPSQGRFQKGGVTQTMRAAAYVDHLFVDRFNIFPLQPSWLAHR